MRRLLHLSDVHFGPPHRAEVSAGALRLIEERRPDVVVLSGDLTQRAKPHQFLEARAFVDRIAVPTLTVPGNHDVPMYRVWERVFTPYRAYRKHFDDELEPVWRDDELLLVGVNTAFNWTIRGGRITRRRIGALEAQLAAAPNHLLKVVVAHHHLVRPAVFGNHRPIRNARRALAAFSRAGVDLVLSGHRHVTFLGSSEDFYPAAGPPVLILHSGTSTSSRGRAEETQKCTCNWIEADAREIAVTHLVWHDDVARFEDHSRHLYPRQERVPYRLG